MLIAPSEMLLFSSREKLQTILCRYANDTLSYINRVKSFHDKISKWILQRETELDMVMDIIERAEKIDLSFSHVNQSENKARALWEYMGSATTLQTNLDKKFAVLEEELAAVLKDTDNGLQELDEFLDAVEKLAFTSIHVFRENNNMLRLPTEISLDLVQVIISAAQRSWRLRVVLTLDSEEFFVPRLQNVEVLLIQLNKYVIITQLLCDQMKKRYVSVSHLQQDYNPHLSPDPKHTSLPTCLWEHELRFWSAVKATPLKHVLTQLRWLAPR